MSILGRKIKKNLQKNYLLITFLVILLAVAVAKISSPNTINKALSFANRFIAQNKTITSNSKIFKITGVSTLLDEPTAVAAAIDGIINKIYITNGQKVSKGEKLIKINDQVARANYEAIYVDHQAERRKSLQISDNLNSLKQENKQTDGQRAGDLLNKNGNIISQLESELKESQIKKKQLHTKLRLADKIRKQHIILSPVDGQVLALNVRVGESSKNSKMQDGLVVIGNPDNLAVKITIDAEKIYQIKGASHVEASPKGNSSLKIPLTLLRIEPKILSNNENCSTLPDNNCQKLAEIIYVMDSNPGQIFVGQEMEISITLPSKK